MQIIIGIVLLIVSVGMLIIARPKAGQDSAIWLSKPWILGQMYVLAVLLITVIGVSFILNA
jgi:hypothetical protein